jgi:hypothetical protein
MRLAAKRVEATRTAFGWSIRTTVNYATEHIIDDNAGLEDVRLVCYGDDGEVLSQVSLRDLRPKELPDSAWELRDNCTQFCDWGDGTDQFVDFTEEVTTTASNLPTWISFAFRPTEEMEVVPGSQGMISIAKYIGPRSPHAAVADEDWETMSLWVDDRGFELSDPESPILPGTAGVET